MTACLIACIGAATTWLANAATWTRGLTTYLFACAMYALVSHSFTINNGKIVVNELSDWMLSPSDPVVIVFALFAAASLISRRFGPMTKK